MQLGPIAAVRVFVLDVEAAVDFYANRLGLTASSTFDGVAVFDAGGCDLIVEAADPDSAEERALVGRFSGVSFRVEDMQAAYRALVAKGVAFDGEPQPQEWGGVLAHFSDPDGNVLTLVAYP